ncbi:hypothetical protein Pla110_43940 [Polystyrenella longa]|uniref:Helix-turn-helix domain-containing protein n=1 Tax=Polystyrenella longa TaxID=2528007 RepID=A0A518CTT3_9PLAN|nr:helix-turn-helix domain-containing protein [Polystyrenella longa]QDU82633.1 hypothetical protein Pla110_43940 [Polystyrenella longa]
MSTTSMKTPEEIHGYEFGCEGVVPIKEAAKIIGASLHTVRRRVDEEQLRMGKDGSRRTVICRRSIREYLRSIEV